MQLQKGGQVCLFCYQRFFDTVKYIFHKNNHCVNIYSDVNLRYPTPGESNKFIHYQRTEKFCYIQFFDFEAYSESKFNIVKNRLEKIHKPISYSEIIVDTKHMTIMSKTEYMGEDCCTIFLKRTLEKCREIFSKTYELNWDAVDKINLKDATNCNILKDYLIQKL